MRSAATSVMRSPMSGDRPVVSKSSMTMRSVEQLILAPLCAVPAERQPNLRTASSARPAPMLPNRSPSTLRASGTSAPIRSRSKPHAARAAGEEHGVDVAGAHAGVGAAACSTVVVHLLDQVRDRLFELRARDVQRLGRRQAVELAAAPCRRRTGRSCASSTFIASQWPARSSIRFCRRAMLGRLGARRAPGRPAASSSCLV